MRNRRGHPFQCLIPQVVKSMDDRDALDGLNTITVEAVLEPRESNRACLQLVGPRELPLLFSLLGRTLGVVDSFFTGVVYTAVRNVRL